MKSPLNKAPFSKRRVAVGFPFPKLNSFPIIFDQNVGGKWGQPLPPRLNFLKVNIPETGLIAQCLYIYAYQTQELLLYIEAQVKIKLTDIVA